jgi:hypothetical protein
MRRITAVLLAASIASLVPSTAHAGDADRLLGADGAVYSVQRGVYKTLFPNPPSGWGDNVVLALDIVRDGKLQRVLVPGTDDAEAEHSAALALERTTNNGYIVWAGDGVLNLIGFSIEGWSEILELSGDPSSIKRNPQLTTTVDRYQRIGPDGELVAASRTILHLVWFDQGSAGDRVLYTPVVIEDGNILRANRIFDLAELSGEEGPGDGGPTSVGERPQVRGGNGAVAIGFVPPRSRDLVTVELRSIGGELAFLGDKARAVVIDWGRSNPGLPRHAIADEARAVVIDWGHRLLRPSAADLLAKTFLDHFAASDPAVPLEEAADQARGRMLDEGVALRLATASQGAPHVLELARGDAVGSTSHLLEVRPAVRRALPEALAAEVPARIVLSPTGTDAALAWNEGDAVSYQETTADGWSEVQGLTLDSALDLDQAFTLLEQRLGRN